MIAKVLVVAGVAGAALSGSAQSADAADESLVLQSAISLQDAAKQPAADEKAGDKPADAPPPVPADPDSFWKGWKFQIEGGLNGSTGNSEALAFRFAGSADRKTSTMVTHLDTYWAYATSDGKKSKDRWEANIRNDWIINESRWSIYATGKSEWDEFQAWNWRLSAFGGVGYAFVKTDKTLFNGRAGLGLNKELGGDNRSGITPEADLGLDFSEQLTKRQKLYATTDLYPSLRDVPQFRWVTKAGWEILVDPETNMSLKIGVEHRYNSNPGGGIKHNDLDYFLTIVWTF